MYVILISSNFCYTKRAIRNKGNKTRNILDCQRPCCDYLGLQQRSKGKNTFERSDSFTVSANYESMAFFTAYPANTGVRKCQYGSENFVRLEGQKFISTSCFGKEEIVNAELAKINHKLIHVYLAFQCA
jgi:hypothetical protein